LSSDYTSSRDPSDACDGCPIEGRRVFLREALLAVAGAYATLGVAPARAVALSVRFGRAVSSGDEEHTYPIPATDGAMIDKDNQIILVRYTQQVYAFNLSCPHQNTALRWYAEDGQFQCPKHHSRYRPDGVFLSGRATRSMDRFGIRRDGANVAVDVDKFYRQDKNPAEWESAFLAL
jgi:nitrite reductase/ring-hydroxylating ferredoxin subunit